MMSKWMKKTKWMIAASMMLVVLAGVSVVHGGGRWSGVDPEFTVDESYINVWVEWPEEHTCNLDETIEFEIKYGKKAKVKFVAESKDSFECSDGSTTTIKTNTNLKKDKKLGDNELRLKAKAHGSEIFPVRVLIYQNGELVGSCDGETLTTKKKGWSVDCFVNLK